MSLVNHSQEPCRPVVLPNGDGENVERGWVQPSFHQRSQRAVALVLYYFATVLCYFLLISGLYSIPLFCWLNF